MEKEGFYVSNLLVGLAVIWCFHVMFDALRIQYNNVLDKLLVVNSNFPFQSILTFLVVILCYLVKLFNQSFRFSFSMRLETSKMKIQANDWFDFAMLAYVQPGDKYFTYEKRWNRLIEEAGCGDYLFQH
jgi:hypothetical protein